MRRYEDAYALTENDRVAPDTFNPIHRDLDARVDVLEESEGGFQARLAVLIAGAQDRIDDVLRPAFERVQAYQSGGFLSATLVENSAVDFVEGMASLGLGGESADLFVPSPFVALMRSSTTADRAIARPLGYDAATGVLDIEIVSVTGDPGPHEDVIVVATAGSFAAQAQYLDETENARDLARDWAEKPFGQDVDGSGTRSAKHHATAAGLSAQSAAEALGAVNSAADAAAGSASTAAGSAVTAGQKATLAGQWAENAEDAPVTAGKFSAKHWALKAAAYAASAAGFDPSVFLRKDGTTAFTGKQTLVAAGSGLASLNVPTGADPSAPTAGDLWSLGSSLKFRLSSSVSAVFAWTNVAQSFSALQTFLSGLVLTPGSAPASPVDGQLWATAAGLFARINGASLQVASMADVSPKANSADVYTKTQTYTKTEADALIGAKANASDVYTKSQVDALADVKVTEYTASGNHTFDTRTKFVLAEGWGGGGGGEGGGVFNVNGSTPTNGGDGGQGGHYFRRWFKIEDLPATVSHTIGGGGTSGAGASGTQVASGSVGGAGNPTTLGTTSTDYYTRALGGAGGGTSAVNSADPASAPGKGGAGSAGAASTEGEPGYGGGAGGGGGAGAGTGSGGAARGGVPFNPSTARGAAPGSAGSAGAAASTVALQQPGLGGGGGGSGASSGDNGLAGGAGGYGGGGGGGGGCGRYSTTTTRSGGPGGVGGGGLIRYTEWF